MIHGFAYIISLLDDEPRPISYFLKGHEKFQAMKGNKRLAKKILLVGWGSAEWKIIDPLIEQGRLPTIESIVEQGTRSTIAGYDPPLLSTAWNTIFTGKAPFNHQVKSFTEIEDGQILPVSSRKRKVKSIWQILSDNNLKAHQIGAWASHPTEAINGISVSDLFPYFTKENISAEAVFPNDQLDRFSKHLVKAEEISDEELAHFISSKEEGEYFSKYISKIKNFIAQVKSIHNAAKEVLANEEWDFLSVVYAQLSRISFQFMSFHLSEKTNTAAENDLFKEVLNSAYIYLDKFLAELIELAGEEATIFLLSQGGFPPDELWLEKLRIGNSTWEYNSDGLLLFKGKNSLKKSEIYGIEQGDITPTILVLLGLPLAKDFNGKVFIAKRFFKQNLEIIESFENEKTETNKAKPEKTFKLPESILQQQLDGLNYHFEKQEQQEELNQYFDARVQIQSNLLDKAVVTMEDLWKKYPQNSWYGGRLAGCYLSQNKLVEAQELINTVLAINDQILDLQLIKAKMLMSEMKFRSASKIFEEVASKIGLQKGIYSQIADAYLNMNQPNLAVKYFKKENKVNPHPAGFLTLGMILLQNKKSKKALVPLRKALDLAPGHPMAQFHLGQTLYSVGEYEEAAEVLEDAKKSNRDPEQAKKINQMLVDLYKNHLEQPEKIQEMQKAFQQSIGSRGTITIVSGLPRSGTSMMMQMLERGGMEAFTDGLRTADENNKKGYFEHEAVKNLMKDKRFLTQVGDKFVKIISHLLFHLPHVYKYKIVFMDRDIQEVMHSQHKMLGRMDKERGKDIENSLSLLKMFEDSRKKAIDWCKAKQREQYVELLVIPYGDVVANPLKYAKQVNEFLGGNLDVEAMASIADKSLYREKADEIKA